MLAPVLTGVHKQRIREAVKVAQLGGNVQFRVNPTGEESGTVVWWVGGRPGSQHVLCRGYGDMTPWLEVIRAEFAAQLESVQ